MYKGPIIDADVHHTWGDEAEIIDYLPARWQEYYRPNSGRHATIQNPGLHYLRPGSSSMRLEAEEAGMGASPGNAVAAGCSDYEVLRSQLLDRYHIDRAVLTFDVGSQAGYYNPELAGELCRAANQWSIEKWLSSSDDRLYGAIQVATHVPSEGAAEITRRAGHPRVAVALLVSNPLTLPFGHPVYEPIYKACAETGLPLSIHVGGELQAKAIATAGGLPASRLEEYVLVEQPAMAHLVSIIVGGVFERYPTLRVMLTEYGFAWVPWLLWSLDGHYSLLKRESSWVKRLPSEYFREHVWLTTQPWEFTPKPERLQSLLDSFGGLENRLCFATDYPHWDADEPLRLSARLPKSWLARVFAENARAFYGWNDETAVAASSTREEPATTC